MIRKATLVWIVGLVTLVPYGTYYLFVHAQHEQYALLITLVLFWIFGYWGVVGPILAALKVRLVMRAIEMAQSRDDLKKALQSRETEDVVVELIASENHIPRFLAVRVYRLLIDRLSKPVESHLIPADHSSR